MRRILRRDGGCTHAHEACEAHGGEGGGDDPGKPRDAAVGITNALRSRLPYGTWRKLHYLTLPAWLLASLHGVLAGSDRADPWFAGIAAAAVSAAALAFAVRFSVRGRAWLTGAT